jgi:hypothetical protein
MNDHASTGQSTIGTVLAWELRVLSGFSLFGALMQNVMINFVFPTMLATMPEQSGQTFPPFTMIIFRVFALVLLSVAVFSTYAAYALLKRRNWARRTFIVLFALGIAWNVLGVLAFGIGFSLATLPTSGTDAVPFDMQAMLKGMVAVLAVFTVAMSVLFGWLIKRLHSPSIKAEFTEPSPAS